MGHLALLSNDIQQALDDIYHPELKEYLTQHGEFNDLLDRWLIHYKLLCEEMNEKMTYNNETIFWSVGRYQEHPVRAYYSFFFLV